MVSKSIFIIFGVLSAAQVALGMFWEFGNPRAIGTEVIAHHEGHMGIFEHSKTIQIPVPQCFDIAYVRVTVDNMVSRPEVMYSPYNQEVTIHYNLLQSGLSAYDVIAKGYWRPGCIPQRPLGR